MDRTQIKNSFYF